MSNDLPLHQRRRSPSAAELASIPWLQVLQDEDQSWVNSQIVVGDALAGDVVCRIGKAPTYWFGVVQGLLKMSADNAQGDSFTYAGLSAGGWFGEGTVIKREPYRYNVQAL
ncbi:MAG: Crp/Fnr family transcriptional regulator, partial [Betaproteobacteria bacterium]|nr:Crp/Fnr family transcriptional regulator [Betaproteobacteria bacterium]